MSLYRVYNFNKVDLIVGVLNIKSNTIYGTTNNGKMYMFKPHDKTNYPNFIVVSKLNPSHYTNNLYIVIKYHSWDAKSKYPRGECFKIIGEIGITKNEITHLLYANGFGMRDVCGWKNKKNENKTNETNEMQNTRKDFRDKYVFSIDPKGCKDVDDAIHIEKDGNGNVNQIVVHISDVSEHVKIGSDIDAYAKQRMTSIYLSEKTYHMLPMELSEDKCSLLQGKERLTLSLVLKLDDKKNIVDHSFHKGIIINRKQLTYEQAENYINSPPVPPNTIGKNGPNGPPNIGPNGPIIENIKILHKIVLLMKQSQTLFDTDKHLLNNLDDTTPKSHEMIETLMIICNIFCAIDLNKMYGDCILRTHQSPDIGQNLASIDSMNVAIDDIHIRKYLHLKSQMAAQYELKSDAKHGEHYGLSASYYTHFTSPIRRYIDLVNHRLLKSMCSFNKEELNETINNANDINKRSKKLYRYEKYIQILDKLENGYLKDTHIGYVVDFCVDKPEKDIEMTIYIPNFNMTKNVTICHSRVRHLMNIDLTLNRIKIFNESEKCKVCEYTKYQKIFIKLIPIINSENYQKKLAISIESDM